MSFYTSFFLIPTIIVYVLTRNRETYLSSEFMQKWGFLFDEIKYQDRFFSIYYLIYAFRRLSFVCLSFYVLTPTYQRVIVQITNLLNFWYIGQSPLNRRTLNRLEMLNELVVCLVCLHSNFFTDWVDDPHVQSMYGWSMIIIVSLHMAF